MPGRIEGYEPVVAAAAVLPWWLTKIKIILGQQKK